MNEPFVGEVSIFPYEYEPDGWLRCDGQAVAIRSYAKLFTLLGTRFGGAASISSLCRKYPHYRPPNRARAWAIS